jgi:hypothetical protein
MPGRLATAVMALGIALFGAAAPAAAQTLIHGFNRSDQTDVSGLAVTSADLLGFDAAALRTYSCPAAWGVRTTANTLESSLRSATLPVAGQPLPAALASDLRIVLLDEAGASQAERRLAGALSHGNAAGAARPAQELSRRLRGLVARSGRMDPARPGYVPATQLTLAIEGFNHFIDASEPAYLAADPAEVRAIRAVLGEMVGAAIEHDGRDAVVRTPRTGQLACAPPAFTSAPVAPPAERRISVCVAAPEGPRVVEAVQRGEAGEPLALATDGTLRPLREVHPAVTVAGEQPWYGDAREITVGGQRYLRYGLPRTLGPGAVDRVGDHLGVPIYVERGVAAPEGVYLAHGVDCTYQEYRPVQRVREVRG